MARAQQKTRENDAPAPSRAEARAKALAAIRVQTRAEGREKDMFPTAEPYSLGLQMSYPLTVVGSASVSGVEEAPVSEGELATLAHEINRRFALADRLDTQSGDHRLAAAIRLSEARKICEVRSMPFRKWAEAHISQKFDTVRKMTRIGSADNPKLALEAWRDKNAEANRELRAKKKLEVQALIESHPSPPEPTTRTLPPREGSRWAAKDPVEAMLAEFEALPRDAQSSFLARAAERMGALVELPE